MMTIVKDYPCRKDNYSKRTGKIEYIVIHYVGAGGSAKDNAMYYNREYVGNSAHFFVGHAAENGAVYQSVDPANRAWHCGAENGRYVHPYCRNDNAIGVELCCKYDANRGWYFDSETVKTAAELVRYLMQTYGVPMDGTYVGKAYTGLREIAKREGWQNKKVLFIHTGGTPLFFDAADKIL